MRNGWGEELWRAAAPASRRPPCRWARALAGPAEASWPNEAVFLFFVETIWIWEFDKTQSPDRRWIPCSKRGSGHGGSQMSRSILGIKRPMMSTNNCTFGLGTCAELSGTSIVKRLLKWSATFELWSLGYDISEVMFESCCSNRCVRSDQVTAVRLAAESGLSDCPTCSELSACFQQLVHSQSTSFWVSLYTSLLPCRKKTNSEYYSKTSMHSFSIKRNDKLCWGT